VCGAKGWWDATLQSVVGRDLKETPGIESVNYSGPLCLRFWEMYNIIRMDGVRYWGWNANMAKSLSADCINKTILKLQEMMH
jgi:hypothetical protein